MKVDFIEIVHHLGDHILIWQNRSRFSCEVIKWSQAPQVGWKSRNRVYFSLGHLRRESFYGPTHPIYRLTSKISDLLSKSLWDILNYYFKITKYKLNPWIPVLKRQESITPSNFGIKDDHNYISILICHLLIASASFFLSPIACHPTLQIARNASKILQDYQTRE